MRSRFRTSARGQWPGGCTPKGTDPGGHGLSKVKCQGWDVGRRTSVWLPSPASLPGWRGSQLIPSGWGLKQGHPGTPVWPRESPAWICEPRQGSTSLSTEPQFPLPQHGATPSFSGTAPLRPIVCSLPPAVSIPLGPGPLAPGRLGRAGGRCWQETGRGETGWGISPQMLFPALAFLLGVLCLTSTATTRWPLPSPAQVPCSLQHLGR